MAKSPDTPWPQAARHAQPEDHTRSQLLLWSAPMSEPTPAAAPAAPPPQAAPAAPAVAPPRRLLPRLLWLGALVALAALALVFVWYWWSYRRAHSITEDAFVE